MKTEIIGKIVHRGDSIFCDVRHTSKEYIFFTTVKHYSVEVRKEVFILTTSYKVLCTESGKELYHFSDGRYIKEAVISQLRKLGELE